MKYFFILLILVACGKKVDEAKPQPNARKDELNGKYQEAIAAAKKAWDQETGWPDAKDCDGTLWAGLGLAAGVSTVQLDRAKQADGKIHRRPTTPCWANGQDLGSDSTISKDMLTGYMFGMWRSQNSSALDYLQSYGESHNWVMGDPASNVGSVLLTSNGITTLCLARHQPKCELPVVFGYNDSDFTQHLDVLGILLYGEVKQNIPEGALKDLTQLAYDHPKDALFQTAYSLYTTGDYSYPIDLLLGDYVYPSYVRGSDNYRLVHWLFTADLILRHLGGSLK